MAKLLFDFSARIRCTRFHSNRYGSCSEQESKASTYYDLGGGRRKRQVNQLVTKFVLVPSSPSRKYFSVDVQKNTAKTTHSENVYVLVRKILISTAAAAHCDVFLLTEFTYRKTIHLRRRTFVSTTHKRGGTNDKNESTSAFENTHELSLYRIKFRPL